MTVKSKIMARMWARSDLSDASIVTAYFQNILTFQGSLTYGEEVTIRALREELSGACPRLINTTSFSESRFDPCQRLNMKSNSTTKYLSTYRFAIRISETAVKL